MVRFPWFPQEEIGWTEIGEEFTRFTLLKTPWFRVYLHRLVCEQIHPQCHDHPWSFVTVILRKGYWELHDGYWSDIRPGMILYRPAEYAHTVATGPAPAWSLVFTGPKRRKWGFLGNGNC